jgi:hypothetical protein
MSEEILKISIIMRWLTTNYSDKIEDEKRFDWCKSVKTARYLPFVFI